MKGTDKEVEQWEKIDPIASIRVLSPVPSKGSLPCKIYCNTKVKLYNVGDWYGLNQLAETARKTKFRSTRSPGTRGTFYNWLKSRLNLNEPTCSEFLSKHETYLFKIKNKRQFLMFLNSKLNELHHASENSRLNVVPLPPNCATRWISKFLKLVCIITLLLLISSISILLLFLHTDVIESCFIHDEDYQSLVKIFKKKLFLLLQRENISNYCWPFPRHVNHCFIYIYVCVCV